MPATQPRKGVCCASIQLCGGSCWPGLDESHQGRAIFCGVITNVSPLPAGESELQMFNSDKQILDRLRAGRVKPIKLAQTAHHEPVTLSCGVSGCDQANYTHVVDVVWETDPGEQDRRWVRMELRCENGHGFVILFRNHAGVTRVESAFLDDEVSPFAEGARW